MNKIIVIEGTDCSGKKTQCNMLLEHLKCDGVAIQKFSFPNYNSPTGKIVGGSYLGKKSIGSCLFEEGAIHVDPKVASLYYAADRKYNLPKLNDLLTKNNLLLDRYVESNMAHQGGKIFDSTKRLEMYQWIGKLEYDLLELPKPDFTIFLYMPYQYVLELKKNRNELDHHELSEEHLKNAEQAYLELAELHHYKIIYCMKEGKIRTKEDIHSEIYDYVIEKLKIKG